MCNAGCRYSLETVWEMANEFQLSKVQSRKQKSRGKQTPRAVYDEEQHFLYQREKINSLEGVVMTSDLKPKVHISRIISSNLFNIFTTLFPVDYLWQSFPGDCLVCKVFFCHRSIQAHITLIARLFLFSNYNYSK